MAPAEVRSAVVDASERPRPGGVTVHRFSGRRISVATVRPSTGGARPVRPARVVPEAPRAVAPSAPAGSAARPAARVAVVEAPVAAAELGPLDEAIVAELRAALRGRATAELSGLLSAPTNEIEAALHALAARGAVVARGPRWYVG